jgi:phage tail tube protein FII
MAEVVKINGRKYSWASLEVQLDGLIFQGITSLNYKQSLTPAKVGGQGVYPLDATVGEYEAEGDMEMNRKDADALRAALAAKTVNGSYALAEFDAVAQFDDGTQVQTDKLVRCRIKEEDSQNARSSDASMEKIGLHVMWIEKNGRRMLAPEDAGR